MAGLKIKFGLFLDYFWIISGLFLDYFWIISGLFLDYFLMTLSVMTLLFHCIGQRSHSVTPVVWNASSTFSQDDC